jgi:hypothetical protein
MHYVSDTEGPTTEEVLIANERKKKSDIQPFFSGYERWSDIVPISGYVR